METLYKEVQSIRVDGMVVINLEVVGINKDTYVKGNIPRGDKL